MALCPSLAVGTADPSLAREGGPRQRWMSSNVSHKIILCYRGLGQRPIKTALLTKLKCYERQAVGGNNSTLFKAVFFENVLHNGVLLVCINFEIS